jgi:hypothetical protein
VCRAGSDPPGLTRCGAQGGRELSKDVSDKQCAKCELLVDRKGQMKAQCVPPRHGGRGPFACAYPRCAFCLRRPNNVPEKNPVSGQPNAFYGWTPAGGAKQADPSHQE